MSRTVYTIGHSNHAFADFLALLTGAGVTVVADVRSMPYSRFNPQFNRETLRDELHTHEVGYDYFGRELGGRSSDAACYEAGRIRYDLVAKTAVFKAGLVRLKRRIVDCAVALLCAEKEPLACHRTLLVSQALAKQNVHIAHIHADGTLESHDAAMDRLLAKFSLRQDDLFTEPTGSQPRHALIEQAIVRQAGRVGHAGASQTEALR